MIKLVVLDWDDCITRGSSEGYYACYTAAIKHLGVEKDPDEIRTKVRELWGRPHRDVIASIVGDKNPLLNSISEYYEQCIFTNTFSAALELIPGADEKLRELKETYQLAIATGMNGTLLREQILPRFNMEGIFSTIASSSELPDPSRGKPYPDLLLKILKELTILPEEAVMVGDAKGDVLMAQAAKVQPIVVLTGQLTEEEAKDLGAETIIPDITYLDI
ncbi:MAG: putative phosphatase related to gph [Parcubacteria group bacterium]|nr:putative phosphatase related to gph [Parcubacteria group bacterium]